VTVYRDRTGQRIGHLEVLADHGRTKRGAVLWKCLDHKTGRMRFLTTSKVIRADRTHVSHQDGK
jgi:hypothetical protein